jgi:hypothetical protein
VVKKEKQSPQSPKTEFELHARLCSYFKNVLVMFGMVLLVSAVAWCLWTMMDDLSDDGGGSVYLGSIWNIFYWDQTGSLKYNSAGTDRLIQTSWIISWILAITLLKLSSRFVQICADLLPLYGNVNLLGDSMDFCMLHLVLFLEPLCSTTFQFFQPEIFRASF